MGLRQLFENRALIMEGLQNTVFRKEAIEQAAESRLEVCRSCPSFDTEGDSCFVPGTQPCCKECGCCLAMKTRSLAASCPIGKWPALLTEQEADSLPTDSPA